MNPVGLRIRVVRYAGEKVVECREVLVTQIISGGQKGSDRTVVVYWGGGAGELEFSLSRGTMLGKRGRTQPWRLEPEGARHVLKVSEAALGRCDRCHQPTWFAAELDPDDPGCAGVR
jgi:hypothetical protein